MPKLARECPICRKTWMLDYGGLGRPREICYTCQPEGFKVVRMRLTRLRKDPYRRRSEAGAA